MKIAVLTSGGDSAGMNAVVRAVVKAGIIHGCETWVVREGYEGLVRGNAAYNERKQTLGALKLSPRFPISSAPSPLAFSRLDLDDTVEKADAKNLASNLRFGDGDLLKDGTSEFLGGRTLKGRYIVRVGWDDVRGWFAEGGTLIGTARSKAFRTREGRSAAAYNLIVEGIDALVVCGGDGSLTGADTFRAEWPELIAELHAANKITKEQFEKHSHLKIVGLVGSIDNDMAMTNFTIGAATALHRICEAIDNINSTASSHSRAFVVEVMGRDCGWLALQAGIAGGADFIFLPERPPKADCWEDEMCAAIQHVSHTISIRSLIHANYCQHRDVGKRKTIVIIAEGAHDKHLNPIRAEYVKDVLADRLGLDTRVTTLGHTQRGGRPCAVDRIIPTLQGLEAVKALLEAKPETPSYMIGLAENKIIRVPLVEAVAKTKSIAKAVADKDFDLAMNLRGQEYIETLEQFVNISTLVYEPALPPEKRMRIGIMHVGAPAGGMNAASRAAARHCLRQGHVPLAIHNGFRGLLDRAIDEMTWLGVDAWAVRGGSELGTNRILPSVDLGSVAARLQEYKIQGLLVIGGYEALSSLVILEEGRKHYPAFQIPIVHLPATLSNNVPVTDFSLGSDTSLNALVDACDAIKQSASASRDRMFVVETQGGKCGYIATLGALATGASLVYTPEHGITLDTLRADVEFLRTRYKLDVQGRSEGRLVIRNEYSSEVYTTAVITKMLQEEGGSLFDARSAALGHTLQGGIPSPLDRSRAVRLSLMCMTFLEEQHELLKKQHQPVLKPRDVCHESVAVITIQADSVKFVPVREMLAHADASNRRGKETWWSGIKNIVEVFAGRPQFLGLGSVQLELV
ncbi:hypothetical protein AMATHDRAFT_55841 [Amanita thiersii Skay4041]|uniref:ATP-dependent 6-phosphofructokinase n=1 Tax=Amanita thiersii Skay4041 TaxID=703135 RepID=A0A2A9NYC2_9AGAR|nr:hypothetical protein AMATHDRAFT_55841 [Amanita thiersii Skay4041]